MRADVSFRVGRVLQPGTHRRVSLAGHDETSRLHAARLHAARLHAERGVGLVLVTIHAFVLIHPHGSSGRPA